jgi:polyisoprenoid-binding protein YceI
LERGCRRRSRRNAPRSSEKRAARDSDHKVAAGFDAELMLRRSDFGVGRYVPMTSDELSVHISLEAGQE